MQKLYRDSSSQFCRTTLQVVDFVGKVIDEYYPNGKPIPPHSRMRHTENVPAFHEMVSSTDAYQLSNHSFVST